MYHSDLAKQATLGINKVKTELRQVPVDLIRPGIWQQRTYFAEQALIELASSMKQSGGNITPIVLAPNHDGSYSIISGERRWRAAQMNGDDTLKALVGGYNFEQATYIAAAENLQREDLNPIEEATSYLALKQHTGLLDEEIAAHFGKSRSHVSNYIRLLSLDFQVKDALIHGRLSFSQARPLCTLQHHSQQRNIALEALQKDWSARQISDAVSKIISKPKVKVSVRTDADIKRLERAISEATGHPCKVLKSPKGEWQIALQPGGDDQFIGLLEKLGVETDMDLKI
ncbi:ParB/RepB/Spo0J family partition protein [Pseudomonas sp. NPDC089569]|uniref:ParB/RepB/Spo0J family partition protein n=1 Tax=Pseudomonas sp. NPDC089569 TaxID=3390722 RepID=UPI003CFC78BD